MKSTRGAGRGAPAWSRYAGYGGALVLVAAAVAVLVMPLLDKDSRGASGGRPAADAGAASTAPRPGRSVPGAVEPEPQQSQGNTPGQDRTATAPNRAGGGPAGPAIGGGTLTWCPAGTAFYRSGADGLEVTVNVSASGLVRAEVTPRGGSPQSRQTTATGARPVSFRFPGVTEPMVERVKITTVSVGVAMQTCYAQAGV